MSVDANKKTLGEELFLVHLSRQNGKSEGGEDDIKHPRRERGLSIGEELWQVHCTRAAAGGLENDGNGDEMHDEKFTICDPAKDLPTVSITPTKPTQCEKTNTVIHHLRNRDVV